MTHVHDLIAFYRKSLARYRDRLAKAEYGPVQRDCLGWIEHYKGKLEKLGETE